MYYLAIMHFSSNATFLIIILQLSLDIYLTYFSFIIPLPSFTLPRSYPHLLFFISSYSLPNSLFTSPFPSFCVFFLLISLAGCHLQRHDRPQDPLSQCEHAGRRSSQLQLGRDFRHPQDWRLFGGRSFKWRYFQWIGYQDAFVSLDKQSIYLNFVWLSRDNYLTLRNFICKQLSIIGWTNLRGIWGSMAILC